MRRVVALLMLVVLVVMPSVRAYAFVDTGSVVANMTYSIAANRAVAQSTATELAYYMGAETAGTSMLSRILARGPVKKLLGVAALAGVGYFVYKLATGDYASGEVPAPESDAPPQAGSFSVALSPSAPAGSSFGGFTSLRPGQAANYFNQYNDRFGGLVGYAAETEVANGNAARAVSSPICGYPLAFYKYEDTGGTGRRATINGVVYVGGFWMFGTSCTFPDPAPFTIPNPDKYYIGDPTAPATPKPDTQPATVPDAIPADADVDPARIADDLNDAARKALEKYPDNEALKELVRTPITPEEVKQVAPDGDTKRKVATARQPDPVPAPQPDPSPTGLPKADDVPSDPADPNSPKIEGIPGFKFPSIFVSPFKVAPQSCPTVDFDLTSDKLAPIGLKRGKVVIDAHCTFLADAANWLRPCFLFLAVLVGLFSFRRANSD